MSDSSTEYLNTGDTWIPYSKRPEWQDVTPIEQDEGPAPVAKIAYSEKFVDVYNYFRAIVCSGEISKRALELSKDAAELNPANYSVWHHRRYILKGLFPDAKEDLSEEMDYSRAVIEAHPKNYQVWQHRRALVEWINDGYKELRLTEIILSQDPKNYHAWQHRQWAVQTFEIFDNELSFIEKLLDEDVRNNSAWNQRFFVVTVHKTKDEGSGQQIIGGKTLWREVDYVLKAISKVPSNESSWNYLKGLMDHCDENDQKTLHERLTKFCLELYKEKNVRSPYLLATMVDLNKEDTADVHKLKYAQQLCKMLADDYDKIRSKYWEYISESIQSQIAKAS